MFEELPFFTSYKYYIQIEVSAKTSSVPNAIIPEQILGYIRDNFNSSPVVQIERKRYGYKLELASKQELKFNKQFVFLGLD